MSNNPKIKILVIEDEEIVRITILEILARQNFETFEAENGIKGIEIAREKKPDLIICDVRMRELDGYGVLKALRSEPATAAIPFIFITGLSNKADTRKGMEEGADDYIIKPFTPAQLLKAIAARLEKQAAIKQQEAQKLDELRRNITLSLPHELRTPLNGIMGFSQLLLTELDSLDKSEIREMVEQIQAASKRLYRLIQNFLLYADLEVIASHPERIKALRSHRIEYAKTMIADIAIHQAKKAQRENDLHLHLADGEIQISAQHLNKLVEELIDNAFKFSETGTPIYIISMVKNNFFILSVSDKGRGMNAEQIANLGAYMQFDRKLYEQQGSGLGLAIAKRLAELYGGELFVESIPGQQTTVRVVIPTPSQF
ncbi:hybrid sensor histidine kinase/response regulator [Planktothrix sp. FACHB-1355]|uniref:histidine kinase n=1 Tax=Aerosakkonema funiforme FACHB-1375 TaxID=2949571 RepID=A0A926ZK76_9CYAN|nr:MULTISPECIES: hybrid sensor histidine kinase/response regulator [Oscillatoriales]MBD2183756.1 hybrid sensor histidine kinase/response regulator [Aerosakkonema funiforme FACHB-1375]MBD3559773.1 hybrid sensor histidine kinase/response regulator [Planktothrix sp. FACHB-1355]